MIVIEIGLHLLAVQIEDVHVHDSQTTTPSFVAVSKILVTGIEDVVNEGKVIFDLLVTLDVEALWGLGNRSLKVRHVESIRMNAGEGQRVRAAVAVIIYGYMSLSPSFGVDTGGTRQSDTNCRNEPENSF
jgi:hypothetical protein